MQEDLSDPGSDLSDPWFRKIPWRRKWQPTLVFLPGESHGQWSLVGSSPQGRKGLDTTEGTEHAHVHVCMCVLQTCTCVVFNDICRVVVSVLRRAQLFVPPWTADHQAPPSMRFSRQEYCSGLPFPTPGDLPNSGIKPTSLASPALAGRFFTTEPPGESFVLINK